MTSDPHDPTAETVRRTVQRHAGANALRKLRHLVDAEQAKEESDRHFVRRFAIGFSLVLFAVVVGWLWFRGVI